MNKLIAKTAVTTLVVVIACSAVLISLSALFFPEKMVKRSVGLGLYGAGAYYQQIAHNRNQTVEGLGKLIDCAVMAEDHSLVIKYVPELLEDTKFASYKQQRNGQAGVKGDYGDYLYGNYAVSLLRKRKYEQALAVAKTTTCEGSYQKYNAMQYLIYASAKKEDMLRLERDYLKELYGYLNNEGQGDFEEAKSDVAKDVCYICSCLGETDGQEYGEWLNKIIVKK